MKDRHIILGVSSTTPSEPVTKHFNLINNDPAVLQALEVKAKIEEQNKKRFEAQGRFAWAKKHQYKGCDPQWHELWELLIPRNGCSCTEDYAKLKSEDPPDFSSPEAYWLWGFRLHNKINVKLERPELSLEDAKKLWNR